MVLALLLLAASMADWVPARWGSNDPASLELVAQTPVNCVLLDQRLWSETFAREAASRGVTVLGVIRPEDDPTEATRLALQAKLAGVVLEGAFEPAVLGRISALLTESGAAVIELPPRNHVALAGDAPIVGTCHGIWPGVRVEEKGAVKAAPTGGPWIDTNSGFLRFLRAATDAPVWIAYSPPPKTVIPVARYLQAISDAASVGARWIVTLDADFERRLLGREASALDAWRRMAAYLKYFKEHKEWREFRPYGKLAVVQGADSGSLLSGSLLDMVVAKHTPVRPVPRWKLSEKALSGSKMTVNADPDGTTDAERQVLRGFARGGGTLLSGPPGWKFPPVENDQVTLAKEDQQRMDEIWREVRSLVGRMNLGARLFNVSSMLSTLLESPDGRSLAIQLVNYSGYPVESVTAHVLGSYRQARLLSPEAPPKDLEVYPIEDGSGVDIPDVSVCVTLVLER